jgi:hypothetical protein
MRDGQRLHEPAPGKHRPDKKRRTYTTTRTKLYLETGDEIRVDGPNIFTLRIDGNRYRIPHGIMQLRCRDERIGTTAANPATQTLLLDLQQGVINIRAGGNTRRAAVVTPEMLAFATQRATDFSVTRNPQTHATNAKTYNNPIIIARADDQAMRVALQPTYTGISDRLGIRLNVWPFSLSPLQRPVVSSDHLPEYWDDGGTCATGCGQGYVHGWPLKPFHQQHAIRAGIDEVRPANLHVAVDIQANNFEPVYAIQSGYAESAATGSYGDYKVNVGRFTYWHIVPSVADGQWVTAYRTIIGHVENGHGHIAFEELGDNNYLNPLRPGGPLRPYTDTVAPVIGHPDIYPDGRVIVPAFDPQSFVHQQSYLTPVLALAGLAWRLYNAQGRPLTGLEWALRASGYLPPSLKFVIFAPGAMNPGYACFATQFICKPNWVYNLAGGLTGPLPINDLVPGHYRLSVYAWDFHGNESALDDSFTLPLKASAASVLQPEFGPLDAQFDP